MCRMREPLVIFYRRHLEIRQNNRSIGGEYKIYSQNYIKIFALEIGFVSSKSMIVEAEYWQK